MTAVATKQPETFTVPRISEDVWNHQPRSYSYKAITRGISPQMDACELTYRSREQIDLKKAAKQLAAYNDLLGRWDVECVEIPTNNSQPDCCFVQDTAVVLDEICIVVNMGAVSRRDEVSEVERHLAPYRQIRHILAPATLDGGDVIQLGKRLFVGLSSRTNARGIAALGQLVEPYGYTVSPVPIQGCLHLTTGCGIVNDETILLNPRWLDASAFKGLRQLHVPEDEPWAANTIRVDDAVCLEHGVPRTVEMVQPYARRIETLDISEFRKAEGSLSCLSLIYREASQLTLKRTWEISDGKRR